MDPVALLGILLGLLGLASVPFGVLAYINPKYRMNRYIQKPKKWKKLTDDLDGYSEVWQYEPHPEFIIASLSDSRQQWDSAVKEPWMTYYYPDPSIVQYTVHAKVNDTLLYSLYFLSLDGGRYFVPLSKIARERSTENENAYYYDTLQKRVSNVIGKYYRFRNIEEFIHANKILDKSEKSRAEKILDTLKRLTTG